MKTMILVKGFSEKGKTQSIKRLAKSFPFEKIIRPWIGDNYDSYVIGTVKDCNGIERIVGKESQGDPGSNQKIWIEACVNANCDVIVAASRSYGNTVEDAYWLAYNNGYEVIEVTTHFHIGGPKLPNNIDMRDVFAENMSNLIMKCLD